MKEISVIQLQQCLNVTPQISDLIKSELNADALFLEAKNNFSGGKS